jgi:hypothetical protein
MESNTPKAPIVASVIAVIAIGAFASVLRWGGLAFSIKPPKLMNVLSPLILTAGFIERAVEVIVSPWRDAGANIRSAALEVAKAAVPPVEDKVKGATDALQLYKGTTQQYAFVASFTLGLAAAIVGLRVLSPLLDWSKSVCASAVQLGSFVVVDVVLSAALLSGGADGIHSVVQAFTGFFDATAKKTQQAAGS